MLCAAIHQTPLKEALLAARKKAEALLLSSGMGENLGSFYHQYAAPIPILEIAAGAAAIAAIAFMAFSVYQHVKSERPANAAKPRGTGGQTVQTLQTAKDNNVHCSVFAPGRVAPREEFKIQVHLHVLEDFLEVSLKARRIDQAASFGGHGTLAHPIRRGATVHLTVVPDGLTILGETSHRLCWEGTPAHAVFDARAPAKPTSNAIGGLISLYVDGIAVGEITFELAVNATAAGRPGQHAKTRATAYRAAFISYANEDFDKASLLAQGMQEASPDLELLFDVIAIKPGEEWEKKLPTLIEKADVFYLIWTDDAAKSEWVGKESRQAVYLYNTTPHRPAIRPVLFVRPFPEIPDHLKPFHFGDFWLDARTARRVPLTNETPSGGQSP
jgi:hypothetical protein